MSNSEKHQILVVDDEPCIRDSVAMILIAKGYEVSTATNGFDALLQMRSAIPEVIISDLNMPQMSGFEFLSVVRRRFPEIAVIAVSGAYQFGESVPGGVIADAFYAKGRHDPEALLRTVAELFLRAVHDGSLSLPNRDLDSGKATLAAEYTLADESYVKLLNQLADGKFGNTSPELRANILDFYSDLSAPFLTKKDAVRWRGLMIALDELKVVTPVLEANPQVKADPRAINQGR